MTIEVFFSVLAAALCEDILKMEPPRHKEDSD